MSIQIVTCLGKKPELREWFYRPDVMLESCARFKFTPVILGESDYRGLGSKPKLLKKALHDGTITASHIIWLDGFDCVLAEDPHKIIEEFRAIQHISPSLPSILWNAERACFPDQGRKELHPLTPYSYKYLNSGFMLGESDGFRKLYQEFDPDLLPDDHQDSRGNWICPNDQEFSMDAFLTGSLSMMLDSECRIGQSLFQTTPDDFDFSGEKIKNNETGTYPMVFHANGDSKSNGMYNLVLTKLGYKPSQPNI